METLKGFYFSFDALLALGVMSAALMFVAGIAGQSNTEFDQSNLEADEMKTEARDTMSLASSQTLKSYNETYFDELVAETSMESSDDDMTILEGITYLWASGEFSYSENLSRMYFEDRIEGKYQLRIQEGGNTFTVPRQTERPATASPIVTASGLVSGHTLDAPSEGYRARARVIEANTERTEIYPISPSGNLPETQGFTAASFETTRFIPIEDEEGKLINEAILDLNFREADFGPSDYTVTVNGVEVEGTTLASRGSGGEGGEQYVRYDVTDEIQVGENNTVSFSTDSLFFTGGFLNPGSRLRVDYTKQAELIDNEDVFRKKHLKYVDSQYSSGDDSGVYDIENFEIPSTADLKDVNLTVNAQGVGTNPSPTGWDVKAILNNETVIEETAEGDYEREINVTGEAKTGNNMLQIYINHDGEDQFWGGSQTTLNSGPDSTRQSFLEINYTEDRRVGYDSYEAVVAEEVGENGDGSLEYSRDFPNYEDFSRIKLYPAIFSPDSPRFEARTEGEPYQLVYQTDVVTPSLVPIPAEMFDFDQTNYVNMSDTTTDTRFLEYSLFEYSIFVNPRVGYGALFPTREEAQQDAVERLEEKAGDYFNFENIEPSSVTIGGERRLWGPATVTLVRWEE